MTHINRKSGLYWVRPLNRTFTVARWNQSHQTWTMIGGKKFYQDQAMSQIKLKHLMPPTIYFWTKGRNIKNSIIFANLINDKMAYKRAKTEPLLNFSIGISAEEEVKIREMAEKYCCSFRAATRIMIRHAINNMHQDVDAAIDQTNPPQPVRS